MARFRLSLRSPKHSDHLIEATYPEGLPELVEEGGDLMYDGPPHEIALQCIECGTPLRLGIEVVITEMGVPGEDPVEPWSSDDELWRGN